MQREETLNAPEWAAKLSDQLKESLPQYSGQFVDYAVGQADNAFNEGTAMSDDQMKAVINKHNFVRQVAFPHRAANCRQKRRQMPSFAKHRQDNR